jgi:hypothetical protein
MEFRWLCWAEYVIQDEEDKKFIQNLKGKPLGRVTLEAQNDAFERLSEYKVDEMLQDKF